MDVSEKAGRHGAIPGLPHALWRHRRLVVAATLIAGVLGYAASLLQPAVYEAEARLLLAGPRAIGTSGESGPFGSADASRHVRNQAESIKTAQVAAHAADLLPGNTTVQNILDNVEAYAEPDIDMVTVRAQADSPDGAALLANAVAEAYQDTVAQEVQARADESIAELEISKERLQQRINAAEEGLADDPDNSALRAERDAAVSQLISLEGRADQIAVDASLHGSGVQRFEHALVPEGRAQPLPVRNGTVAALLGLMVAAGFAWWRGEYAQTADSRHDPAHVLGAPLLGEIPVTPVQEQPWASAATPHTPAVTEAYQFTLSSLEYAMAEAGASSILITSAKSGDGKTVTALNLILAAYQDGRRHLLVDADQRKRDLTHLSPVAPEPGLTDLADDRVPFDGCASQWTVSNADINFVPAGSRPDDPSGFFRTAGFKKAVMRIKEQADLAIVDSPPLLAVSDTSAIAGQVDGIVIVVNRGTPIRLLDDIRERLDFIGSPVLGYIFNRAQQSRNPYGYGYGYGH